MLKKILRIYIIVFLLTFIPKEAQASVEDYKYKVLEDDTIEILGYIGDDKHVIVPQEIEGKKVTVIGNYAFGGNSVIRTVVLPENITTIEYTAFKSCSNLERVDIYGNIITLGKYAFESCKELFEVNFYGELSCLDERVFENCENLEYVNLPDSMDYINGDSFRFCNKLEYIDFPQNIEKIYIDIRFMSNLVALDIPDNAKQVDIQSYNYHESLLSLYVPTHIVKNATDISAYLKFKDIVKYNNILNELQPIDSSKLYTAALEYMNDIGYKSEYIEIRDGVENALGIRAYFKTSPEEMYFICVNQDADGNADIIYTRKIDIFEYEKGDVNRDLNIDAKDALEILKCSANMVDLTYPNIRIGDFDSNGKASARDALTLLKYLAGITEEL